jgi:hypothetical protein
MSVVRRRHLPTEVGTIQWTGDNEAEVQEFTGPGIFRAIPAEERVSTPEITASVYDKFHDTWIGVKTGQHIVNGSHGEHYPLDDVAATSDYEVVEEPGEGPAGLSDVVYEAVSTFQVDRHKPGGYDQQLTAHVVKALVEWGEVR